MSTQPRPSTHHKTSRRPGLLSLNEAGISVRGGNGGSGAASSSVNVPGYPSTPVAGGLPPRPSTRGDGSTPLRRPGPLGFTGAAQLHTSSVPLQGGGATQLPRVSTAARSSSSGGASGRPPTWGAGGREGGTTGPSGVPPPSGTSGGRAATAGGPPGMGSLGSAPQGATTGGAQGRTHRRSASQNVDGSAGSHHAAATTVTSAAAAAAALKRPSSQQTTRQGRVSGSSGRGGSSASGGMGGADFHRGLVSALQDVLRQQRQGVFPTVTTDGVEMSRPSRPGTGVAGDRDGDAAAAGGGRPSASRASTSTPLGGMGGRWGFAPGNDAVPVPSTPTGHGGATGAAGGPGSTEEDPFPPARPTAASGGQSRGGARRGATPARGGATGAAAAAAAPWVDEAEDVLLSVAAVQMLRSIERSEGIERRNFAALAASEWDALMFRETSEVVAAARGGDASVPTGPSSRRSSAAATRPSSSSNYANTSAALRRKTSGAQLRVKRHGGSGAPSLDTSTEPPSHNTSGAEQQHDTTTNAPSSSSGGGGALDAVALKAQGNEHYAQRRFLDAHRSYSLAIEADPANAVLLCNRAAVHTMLLNYDACVRDCLRATSIDPTNWKAFSRMARAYAMLGQYAVAARHFTTALLLVEDTGSRAGGPSSGAAGHIEAIKRERGELQHLERARLEAEASNLQSASGLYCNAATFAEEPPVRLLRFGCLLQFSPAVARAQLTKYLSTLDHPATYAAPSEAAATPPADASLHQPPAATISLVPKLLSSRALHYCAVLVTLAKASLYCGVHYLNIAASHLQQCIGIKPDFPGAYAMLTQLTTFEDRLAAATELADADSHADAVSAFTEALDATHDSNAKVRGLVLVQRAESYLQIAMPKPAAEDCSVALGFDGNNVKALTKRARAHEALGDLRAAVADLEHAATINEELAEALVALRMRIQQQQQQQQYRQQQQYHQAGGGGGYFGGSRPGTGTSGRPGTSSSSAEYPHRPGTSQQAQRPCATHYATLGVACDADGAAIRGAYRRLTLQLHPDKVVKEAEDVRRRCEVRFKEVAHAYSVLNDPVQRMQYDLTIPR